MSEEVLRARRLGEIVGGPRDNKTLGRVCLAIFAGINCELFVPVPEQDLIDAGIAVDPTENVIMFSADVNLSADVADEVQPKDFQPLTLVPLGGLTQADLYREHR